jgi:hypothetical protein
MPADGVRYYLDSLIENYRKNKKKFDKLDFKEKERRLEIQRRLMAIMYGRSDKSKCYKESIFNVILGKKALKTIPLNANSYATAGDPALTGVDFLSKFS